jgi:hypothetical protein
MDARRLTFLFVLAVFGSSAAVAQTTINPALSAAPPAIQAAPSPALRAACWADVQKFCSGQIVECMKGYVMELSPGCLGAARAEMQTYQAALAR